MSEINLSALDELLSSVNFDEVNPEYEGSGEFEDLPEGYYLCEVERAEIKLTKSTSQPMVAFMFSVVENGLQLSINERGTSEFIEVPKSKNRKIFINWVLSDENKVKKFASDMLKFEGDTPGVPILDKEYFITSATLEDAINILIGLQIFVNVTKKENKTTKEIQTWNNLVSWERAEKIGLIEEKLPF